jgi:predicted PolB exonuclease-like 3'-5' exonuclease
MMIAAFDVETIPSQNLSPEAAPQFSLEDVKYGNAKKPDARRRAEIESEQKWKEGLDKRMALDGDLCNVVTFCGMKFDTELGDIKSKTVMQMKDDPEDELEIVHEAWDFIRGNYMGEIPLVSFNGIGFDLESILIRRAMILDIPLGHNPRRMIKDLTYRKDNETHYDLQIELVGYYPEAGKSLDFYTKLFGLGVKGAPGYSGEFGAKDVYPAWQAAHYDKIAAYCEQDVLLTALLFQRVEHWVAANHKGR